MDLKRIGGTIGKEVKKFPNLWDGKSSILEMKSNRFRHWKQMEWIGFYFEYLCEKNLHKIIQFPGPQFGKVFFDGFLDIPLDFKAHAINTSSHQIIVNDSEAIADAIKKYGVVGVVIAMGEVRYNDRKRTFQKWHNRLKGEKSKYEKDRIERGAWSRLRKTSFQLQQIVIIQINDRTLVKTGSFQTDFRNSDGSPRKTKVLIDLEKVNDDILTTIDFPKAAHQ